MQQGLGQPACLRTEEKVTLAGERGIPVGLGGLRRHEEPCGLSSLPAQILKRIPHADIHVLPVVETGALQLLVINAEAEGLDEVQPGPCRQAQSSHRARVVWNFGLVEDDVEHWSFFSRRLLLGCLGCWIRLRFRGRGL